MMTVADLSVWLEQTIPLGLAESWDNVGLLLGDRRSPVERVMTCLTITPESAAEAIEERVNLIVSHHPILFRPIQKLVSGNIATEVVWNLARAGIAVYSPHTAFDNSENGINSELARRLKLNHVRPLRRGATVERFKIVVFAPVESIEAIQEQAFSAGAGELGFYRECSFSSVGQGTFFGQDGAQPAVGQAGRREKVEEVRVEYFCQAGCLDRVLAAIRKAHPYEEPAIDVIPLRPEPIGPGVGRIGELTEPLPLGRLAELVGEALKAKTIAWVGDAERPVRTIAVACGAGDDFLKDAARLRADVLLTGEARFHRLLESETLGVAQILPGHYASERPGIETLATEIGRAFPGLEVWPSRREREPLSFASL